MSTPRVSLVLASASPARRATLRAVGIEPTVIVSEVDEDAAVDAARDRYGALDPADVALLLARAKCEAVAAELSAQCVGPRLRLCPRARRRGARQAPRRC